VNRTEVRLYLTCTLSNPTGKKEVYEGASVYGRGASVTHRHVQLGTWTPTLGSDFLMDPVAQGGTSIQIRDLRREIYRSPEVSGSRSADGQEVDF